MGWDDNGLNVERRVQLVTGTIVDPTLPYDPGFQRPEKVDPKARPIPVSRPNFIELCEEVVPAVRGRVPRPLVEPGAVGRLGAHLHDDRAQGDAHVTARVPAARPSASGLPRRVAHALGRRHAHGGRPGRAAGPRARRRLPPAGLPPARRHAAADRHDPSRAPPRLRGGRRPPRRRALPTAVRSDRHHPAVRRRGPDRRPPAGRPGEGHRRRDGLHLRRHHRRHLVARAVAARSGPSSSATAGCARSPGARTAGRRSIPRPRRRPTTSWPARTSSRRRSGSSSCSPRPAPSTARSARSPTR